MGVAFRQDLQHVSQMQGDNSGDVERVRVHGLPLHNEMRSERVICWSSLIPANQRHDDTSDASVEPRRLDLDDERNGLVAPRILINRELRHLG